MNNRKSEVYYGKIMLFGEYSVIRDSMALTIPFAHFQGELSFINDEKYTDHNFALESNKSLKQFARHLKGLIKEDKLAFKMDIKRFVKDIDNGLYFESSIPQGYGIGSSGALCAAIYNDYSINGIPQKRFLTTEDIVKLKMVFSQLESFFHGVSSGLDPLLCFIKYPLLIKNHEYIQTVGIPRNRFNSNGAIFLLDTKRVGKTEPLVKKFFTWLEDPEFSKKVDEEFIPANDGAINALINAEMPAFFYNLRILSKFQYNHFGPMIPDGFEKYWKDGLNTGIFNLKLCGSGGGGFLLGITENYTAAKAYFDKKGIEPLLVYLSS